MNCNLKRGLLFITLALALGTTSLPTQSLAYGYSFGSSGYDGRDGYTGSHGSSGPNHVYFAKDQSPQQFLVSGTDADDGGDGQDGGDATSCYFYGSPSHNMEGAEGGDGGRGGNGGQGGYGGDLTVYLKNKDFLKNILYQARGGQGGRPGRGGREGSGCSCPRYSWSVRKCHIVTGPDGQNREECHYNTFYCSSGRNGRRGSYGLDGGDGDYGSLTLIGLDKPLPADVPAMTLRLLDMPDKLYKLSQHKWIYHSQGGRLLLAPGSILRDDYQEFDKTLHRQFVLRWLAPRPVENFPQTVQLSIQDLLVSAQFPENLWVDSEMATVGPVTTYSIKGLVTKEEAENVHIGKVQESGKNLKLEIKDDAGLADTIKTKFRMTLERKQFLWYRKAFVGDIPQEFVKIQGNSFVVDIGKLKIPAKYLFRGKSIKVFLTIHRSFAGKETEWSVSKKFKI